jgi:hypothetical protein
MPRPMATGTNVQNMVLRIQELLRFTPKSEVLSTIILEPDSRMQCIGIAMVVEEVESQDRCVQNDAVASLVYITTVIGVVLVSTLGFTVEISYYVAPLMLLLLIIFIFTRSDVQETPRHCELELMGMILAGNADSILYFFSLVMMRTKMPDMVLRASLPLSTPWGHSGNSSLLCGDIIMHSLRNMGWHELCALLAPHRITNFFDIVVSCDLVYEVDNMLFEKLTMHEYGMYQRLSLLMAIVCSEEYPSSSLSFVRRRWKTRVSCPLRELSSRGVSSGIPPEWTSDEWVPQLSGCKIPIPDMNHHNNEVVVGI